MAVFLLYYWFLIATARLFKENLRSSLSVLHPSTYIYIYKTAFKRLTATQTHKAPFYVAKTFNGKNITCIIQSEKSSQKGAGQIQGSSVVVFRTKTL